MVFNIYLQRTGYDFMEIGNLRNITAFRKINPLIPSTFTRKTLCPIQIYSFMDNFLLIWSVYDTDVFAFLYSKILSYSYGFLFLRNSWVHYVILISFFIIIWRWVLFLLYNSSIFWNSLSMKWYNWYLPCPKVFLMTTKDQKYIAKIDDGIKSVLS